MRKKPGSLRAAYAKHQKQISERIRTMEMLLDAKWMGGYFMQQKVVRGYHAHCYYDIDGNVISSNQAFLAHKKGTQK